MILICVSVRLPRLRAAAAAIPMTACELVATNDDRGRHRARGRRSGRRGRHVPAPSPRAHTTTRPSAKDRARLEEADLVVSLGCVARAGAAARRPRQRRSSSPPARTTRTSGWTRRSSRRSLDELAAALGGRRSRARERATSERAAAYADELARLDRQVRRRRCAPCPPSGASSSARTTRSATSCDRYDFEFVGAPFGTTPEARGERGDRRRPDRPSRERERAGGVRRGHRRPRADEADRTRGRRRGAWTTS